MNIIDYSIKNRTVTLFLTFVIIVGGIFSYMKLGKLEDPEFRVKEAIVVTLYPGCLYFNSQSGLFRLLQ